MTYTHMRINHPVFDPSQTAPPRFTVQPRTLSAPVTLSAPLSSRTRPPDRAQRPRPAPDHTTRPAPLCASLCASTRAPDATPLSRCHAVQRPTHPDRRITRCEPLYALLSRSPCPIPPQPQNAPRAPQNARCEPPHTRARARPRAHAVRLCTL